MPPASARRVTHGQSERPEPHGRGCQRLESDEAAEQGGLGERTNRLLVEEVDGVLLLGHLGPLALIDGPEPRDHAADGPASGVREGRLSRAG